MKLILIDSQVFDELLKKIEDISQKISFQNQRNKSSQLDGWLDSADVCAALNITKKTLQRLRENDRIGYTQINRKYYYKPEEIERLLKKGK